MNFYPDSLSPSVPVFVHWIQMANLDQELCATQVAFRAGQVQRAAAVIICYVHSSVGRLES